MKLLNLLEAYKSKEEQLAFDNNCEKAKLRAQTLFKAFKKGFITFPPDTTEIHYEFIGEVNYKCSEHHKDPNTLVLFIIIHTHWKLPFPFEVHTDEQKIDMDSFTASTKKDVFDTICQDISKKLKKFNIIFTAHMS